jgi:tripartite-type tricarboxylate transporter receptor subunit TctC
MISPQLLLRALCIASALAMPAPLLAQTDVRAAATRPVRIIVPFLGSGVADNVARLIASRLPATPHPYVVENRPGDEGHFGAEVASKSEPDGHTLLFAPVTFYAAQATLERRHYDLEADFAPVTLIANVPSVLVGHPSLPAKSAAELIALAKARPGQLRWASHGRTSYSQLELELFRQLVAVKVNTVPLGTLTAMTELAAGRVDLLFETIPAALAQIKAGKVRAMGVSGSARSPALRDVPTLAESGARGFEANYWYGILVPDGVSKAAIDRYNAELTKVAANPEVRERLLAFGIETRTSTPAELGRIMHDELARWSKVAAAAQSQRQ